MKYEWRKQDKALYGAKKYPALITIPAQNYIMISGKGNPNDVDFSNRVGALYSLAYAVKSSYKAVSLQEEIHDFAVYPLEGIWIFCAPGIPMNAPKWCSTRWKTASWTGCEED